MGGSQTITSLHDRTANFGNQDGSGAKKSPKLTVSHYPRALGKRSKFGLSHFYAIS